MKAPKENNVYERVRARVKFFSRERGYGFIKRDNKPDVFFSSNELMKSNISFVRENDMLLFDLVPVKGKGGKAVNIKVVDG
jgi:cold shock CspA family protein